MRKSDVHVVAIDNSEGFDGRIAEIAKQQIARDEPRALVGAFANRDGKIILIFELVEHEPCQVTGSGFTACVSGTSKTCGVETGDAG